MRRKLAAVYVYNSKDNTFEEYHNLIYERIEFTHQFDGTGSHIYGRDYSRNIRIEVAKHAEEVFHNRLKHEYVVFLNESNKAHAVEILSNYILNRIEIEISYLENQLSIARAKHKQVKEFQELGKS